MNKFDPNERFVMDMESSVRSNIVDVSVGMIFELFFLKICNFEYLKKYFLSILDSKYRS